jgi:predicted oxidoreductase
MSLSMNVEVSAFPARCVEWAVLCVLTLACSGAPDPDVVVVVGGGPAGLSAAIEAATGGEVLLLERSSRLGGSARYAAGITATPGAEGSQSLPPGYRDRVQSDVIGWTAGLGQPWIPAVNPLDDGLVLRQPVGQGAALMRVLEAEARRRGVELRTLVEVTALTQAKRWEVSLAGGKTILAGAVIVATGGFAGELERVRQAHGGSGPLLRGVPSTADGVGGDMVVAAGGHWALPDRVLFYGHGVPSPDDPSHALMIAAAPGGVWLDGVGAPIAPRTARGEGGDLGPTGTGWLVLDKAGLLGLLLADPMGTQPVESVALVARAGWGARSIEDLSRQTGLPLSALAVRDCPCAALPLRPTSSKSLTGVVTDERGQVLSQAGVPIPGLFAAGEVAGFGGGSHPPVDSTMIAAAILGGRDAGRAVRAAR